MYPGERHPKPTVGVKTMIIVAAAAVPHWRTRARIDALNIDLSAPGGKTTLLAESVVASELYLFC